MPLTHASLSSVFHEGRSPGFAIDSSHRSRFLQQDSLVPLRALPVNHRLAPGSGLCTCRLVLQEVGASGAGAGSPAAHDGKESGHLGPARRDLTDCNTSASVLFFFFF